MTFAPCSQITSRASLRAFGQQRAFRAERRLRHGFRSWQPARPFCSVGAARATCQECVRSRQRRSEQGARCTPGTGGRFAAFSGSHLLLSAPWEPQLPWSSCCGIPFPCLSIAMSFSPRGPSARAHASHPSSLLLARLPSLAFFWGPRARQHARL